MCVIHLYCPFTATSPVTAAATEVTPIASPIFVEGDDITTDPTTAGNQCSLSRSNAESELRQLYNLLKSPLCIGVCLQLIICLVHVYMYIHVATLRERACLSVVFCTQL